MNIYHCIIYCTVIILYQCIENQQDLRQAESRPEIRFRFKKDTNSGGFIELVFNETTVKGWDVLPQLLPCQVSTIQSGQH